MKKNQREVLLAQRLRPSKARRRCPNQRTITHTRQSVQEVAQNSAALKPSFTAQARAIFHRKWHGDGQRFNAFLALSAIKACDLAGDVTNAAVWLDALRVYRDQDLTIAKAARQQRYVTQRAQIASSQISR